MTKTTVSINQTKKTLANLQIAIEIVAAARIQNGLTTVAFETECDRIERCLECQYTINRTELDYNEFALDFIKTNVKDLVFHSNYAGTYLKDVKDVKDVHYSADLQKEEVL